MSVVDHDCTVGDDLCTYPEFGLCVLADDPDDPGEVTLYPRDADDETLSTTWLSADVDHAVPLTEAR
jgi:hypothetical protein